MTVETILSAYMKEFPFAQGEHSENRERYYWLSGFLRSVQAGEDETKNQTIINVYSATGGDVTVNEK